MQEASSNKACVEFAPNEYEMIYTLLYDGQPLLASLFQQVKTWMQQKDYCQKFGYPIPNSKECQCLCKITAGIAFSIYTIEYVNMKYVYVYCVLIINDS